MKDHRRGDHRPVRAIDAEQDGEGSRRHTGNGQPKCRHRRSAGPIAGAEEPISDRRVGQRRVSTDVVDVERGVGHEFRIVVVGDRPGHRDLRSFEFTGQRVVFPDDCAAVEALPRVVQPKCCSVAFVSREFGWGVRRLSVRVLRNGRDGCLYSAAFDSSRCPQDSRHRDDHRADPTDCRPHRDLDRRLTGSGDHGTDLGGEQQKERARWTQSKRVDGEGAGRHHDGHDQHDKDEQHRRRSPGDGSVDGLTHRCPDEGQDRQRRRSDTDCLPPAPVRTTLTVDRCKCTEADQERSRPESEQCGDGRRNRQGEGDANRSGVPVSHRRQSEQDAARRPRSREVGLATR